MSQVVACPKCEKKLAVRDELKGRVLICPQCKGRFTAPAGGPSPAAKGLSGASDEAPAAGGSAMDFLDGLGPVPGPATTKAAARTSASARPAAGKASAAPAALGGARGSNPPAKKKNDQMLMVYIGGGIAAAVLVVVLLVAVLSPGGGGKGRRGKVLFGLSDSSRHQLFNELFLAVDEYGISKDCKQEWFRLADSYKLDHKNIKDILDEGFSRDDWDQPAPAHVTNVTRGTRMDWIGKRHNGDDPILAQ